MKITANYFWYVIFQTLTTLTTDYKLQIYSNCHFQWIRMSPLAELDIRHPPEKWRRPCNIDHHGYMIKVIYINKSFCYLKPELNSKNKNMKITANYFWYVIFQTLTTLTTDYKLQIYSNCHFQWIRMSPLAELDIRHPPEKCLTAEAQLDHHKKMLVSW